MPTTLFFLSLSVLAMVVHGPHDGIHPTTPSNVPDADSNNHPLTVVPGWGVPEGKENSPDIGSTHGGIVVSKDGSIFVSSTRGIFVFNDAGERLRSIEGPEYTDIHAMLLREEDGVEYIYAARNNAAEAIKLKTDGEIVLKLPFPAESGVKGAFRPTAVTVKPNGNILIADGYGTNMVFEFDPAGKYLSAFGGRGPGDVEKFQTPHGIALDERYTPARLLIADREKRRLVHFDLDGKFIAEVITGLRRPCAVSILNGQVAIAELEGRVALLNEKNELVGVLGDNPTAKERANFGVSTDDWKIGVFTAPHGLSWDAEGNLYVQDWNVSGRVSKWVPKQ